MERAKCLIKAFGYESCENGPKSGEAKGGPKEGPKRV